MLTDFVEGLLHVADVFKEMRRVRPHEGSLFAWTMWLAMILSFAAVVLSPVTLGFWDIIAFAVVLCGAGTAFGLTLVACRQIKARENQILRERLARGGW